MLEYRRDIRMGFSFYYTMGSFILTIPFVGAISRLRDSDAFNALFFGDKWGFSIQFELVSFFFGKRRWRWLMGDALLGKAKEVVQPLAVPETIRTSDGVFVIQRQRHFKVRARYFVFGANEGYAVLSSPYELGHLTFFTLDNPMQVIQNCRNVSQIYREMRDELETQLEKKDD